VRFQQSFYLASTELLLLDADRAWELVKGLLRSVFEQLFLLDIFELRIDVREVLAKVPASDLRGVL
jgi:hypothetical protein